MSYCDYEDVGLLLQLTFNETDSKPKASKVTDIISLIASEINMLLVSKGIGLPLVGTDFYNVVRLKNMQGAAGVVGVSFYGNTEDVAGSQGVYYRDEYARFIEQVKTDPDSFKSTVKSSYIGNQVTAGDSSESDISDVMIDNDWTP